MKVAIGAFLAVSLACPTPNMAGSGRQSDTIEVDYEVHVVGRWLERNADAIVDTLGVTSRVREKNRQPFC